MIEGITATPRVKAQHAYTGLGRSAGSYNFGVVPQMGLRRCYFQTFHTNTTLATECRKQLRTEVWNRIAPVLNREVPNWETWLRHYNEQCGNIPPLSVRDQILPWNGEQLNVFHAATRHRDRTDAGKIPCLITFFGNASGTLRIHGQTSHVDIQTKPGGLLLFDSTFDHEVLARRNSRNATDNRGKHAPGRISYVWMANRQTHPFKKLKWIQKRLREQRASRNGSEC